MEQREGESVDGAIAEGRRLGDYTLLRRLGRGGQGEVYEARQESLGRHVALKVLPAHLSLDTERVRRFRREAAAGGRLAHPNIVAVHAVGEDQGVAYIAQELVPSGRTLADEIDDARRRPELPADWVARVMAWCEGIARGLHAAHEAGVVHRDVKPSNVLVTADGAPMLADFGLALMHDDLLRSATGQAMGTPYYMSPEQASDRMGPVDRRSDVFSLGATLYEALTLNRPFEGETRERVVHAVLLHHPPDPHRLRGRVPHDVSVVCMKALEKRPERRYASAEALADDLRRAAAGEPILARPPTVIARTARWSRRHPGRVAALAGVLLLGAWVVTLTQAIEGARQQLQEAMAGEMEARTALAATQGAAEEREDLLNLFTGVFRPTSVEDHSEGTVRDVAIRLRDLLPDVGEERLVEYYVCLFSGLNFLLVGETAEAGAVLERAVEVAPLVEDGGEVARRHRIGVALFHLGRQRYAVGWRDEAQRLFQDALAELDAVGAEAEEDAFPVVASLARFALDDGLLAEAEAGYARVLEIGLKLEDPAERAIAQGMMGELLMVRGRVDEARPLLEQARRTLSTAPMNETRRRNARIVGWMHDKLARRARKAGQAEDAARESALAEGLFVEALTDLDRRFPDGTAETARVLDSYGSFLSAERRYDEARDVLERGLTVAERTMWRGAGTWCNLRGNLATLEFRLGHPDLAEQGWREVAELTASQPASEPGQRALMNLAAHFYNTSRFEDAARFMEELLARTPPGHHELPERLQLKAWIEQSREAAQTATITGTGD